MSENPYRTPHADSSDPRRQSSLGCPVCEAPLRRARFLLPGVSCHCSGRRLRLSNTWQASSLSVLSAIACLLSVSRFSESSVSKPILFGIHILVFLVLGTTWFHLFGKPTLASGFGFHKARLEQERKAYQASGQTSDGSPSPVGDRQQDVR